uniref:Uncharacterized protein n=1 Tax=Yersinia enterocolitica W22703 TaxID=913028 RepID=F4MZH0_YEREN|nr:unknown protein [Yersinia enterocolitica W22703]
MKVGLFLPLLLCIHNHPDEDNTMTQTQLAIDNVLASAESTIQLNKLPEVVLSFITGEQTGVARSGGIFY